MAKPERSNEAPLAFQVTRSRRKTMAMIVHPDNQLEIRCGLRMPMAEIQRFVLAKESWIRRKMQENSQLIPIQLPNQSQLPMLRLTTRERIARILQHFPDLVPRQVTIRHQRRRWGSCSKAGNLSINLCAGLLPEPLLEYIVVHELCHLVHFDHSPKFHQLLESLLPDAKARRKTLQRYLLS